jgi:hypothetical protein
MGVLFGEVKAGMPEVNAGRFAKVPGGGESGYKSSAQMIWASAGGSRCDLGAPCSSTSAKSHQQACDLVIHHGAGPPPPPPGEGAVGGAVGGAVVGGTTGAVIGAQAEQRHGYYLWQGVCYYRYPSGQYAAVDPHYSP